jgi:hypothetical protein
MSEPEFGERIRGNYASVDNPIREGYYVRTIIRTGRLNPGKWYQLTDRKGRFWNFMASEVSFPDRPPPQDQVPNDIRDPASPRRPEAADG